MKKRRILLLAAALAAAALLALLPEARNGLLALCNRLFEASEAANDYAYAYFAVPAGQGTAFAACLLAVCGGALFAQAFLARGRWPLLAVGALLCGAQAYFGLSLPAWASILVYAAIGLGLAKNAPPRARMGLAAVAIATACAALLLWPGVHQPTETASERVRDRLAVMAETLSGADEGGSGETIEVRRVNPRDLRFGERAAREDRSFRLVTVEQERLAKPRWLDLMRVILLLLAAIALVALPFAPFFLLAARTKKARTRREAFASEDAAEAVRAMFRHTASYLAACGMDGGNRLYRDWTPLLSGRMPEDYVRLYGECAALFEEAAYRPSPMGEEGREQARLLLEETERLLYDPAPWREKLRLKYGECLHE